ncbi:hypothetical protein EMMF5_002843 [Cystobasidiomycetes sp. EMM_F5]
MPIRRSAKAVTVTNDDDNDNDVAIHPTKNKGKGRAEVQDVTPAADYTDFLSFNGKRTQDLQMLPYLTHRSIALQLVHPPDIFARAKKYETPVWRSRVPMLQTYLADAAKAVGEQLSTGAVKQICLTIRSVVTGRFLETFVFDFEFIGVSRLFWASATDKETKIEGSPSRAQLAMLLRGLLVKLNVTEGQLSACLEEETTFDIGVRMRDDIQVDPTAVDRSKGREPLWIPGQADRDRMVSIPIRTVNLGVINMQMFVQENTAKTGSKDKPEADIEDFPTTATDKGKKRAHN